MATMVVPVVVVVVASRVVVVVPVVVVDGWVVVMMVHRRVVVHGDMVMHGHRAVAVRHLSKKKRQGTRGTLAVQNKQLSLRGLSRLFCLTQCRASCQ